MKIEDNNLSVSIITPTFNRGKFLEENILSVKNQNYPFIEHIVVDGGSTDNSLDILKKYQETYNLKWISEKDKGCADAMNKGFDMATGDIFCWLDSDDFYMSETIEKVVEVFKKNPGIDVVFGNIFVINAKGKRIDYIKHTNFDIETLIYLTMPLSTQATFWRKELHCKIGKFNEQYLRLADAEFFLRMALLRPNFYRLNKFLASYRAHAEQLTKSIDLVNSESRKLIDKYKNQKIITKEALLKKKKKVLIKRTLAFIKQGDVWYALRGFFRRIIKLVI